MASVLKVMIPEFIFLCFASFLFKVHIVMSGRRIHFEGTEVPHTVLELEEVSLVCEPRNTSSINIYTVAKYLVRSGQPVQGLSDEFEFDCDGTTCTLKIKGIQIQHAGKYSCTFPQTSLVIDVAYSPRLPPVCNSSSITKTFFLDSSQEPFNFSCRSEVGRPPVTMTLFLLYGKGKKKSLMTSQKVEISRSSESVSISYSTPLDASFDNVSLLCDANQQLPKPYDNYTASCEYGPLVLPSFAVAIHPLRYTVSPNEATNITLTCKSNLRGVTLEWNDNKALQSNTEEINATKPTLALNVIDYVATGSELLQCKGYYGRRVAYASAIIDVALNDSRVIKIDSLLVLLMFIVNCCLFIVLFI